MLEEGLLEHDHITLNTIIYCVTKQQTDNQKFIHGRMITCYINYRASREKKHSADIDENNDFCFETPIISKRTDSLLINLTRSPRKKDSRPPLPPPPPHQKLSLFGPYPSPLNFCCPPQEKSIKIVQYDTRPLINSIYGMPPSPTPPRNCFFLNRGGGSYFPSFS